MGIQDTTKVVLWIPSGGLGHCLHNLAWTYSECFRLNCKMYIYGLDKHIPFQYYGTDFLDFLKNVEVEELKTDNELNNFITKYNISENGKNLINNAFYGTGFKNINDDKSAVVVCSTLSCKSKELFNFKKIFIDNILNNPYKYYKNDYNLLIDTKREYYRVFHIEGSYMKALLIMNKQLGITSDDKNYLNVPKILSINYTTLDKKQHYIECIEHSKHTITNILTLDKAIYGVGEKTIDVTDIVINKLCTKHEIGSINSFDNKEKIFEISGSYYMALKVSDKQLNITPEDSEHYRKTKRLLIEYEDMNNKINTLTLPEKETCKKDGILKILKASYGINDKQIDVTKKINDLCYVKMNTNKEILLEQKISIDKQKKQISDIIESKKYIAVHFRFRDKKVFGGYKKKLGEIKELVKKTNIKNVFVATDSPMFFNYLGNNLDNIIIFRYTNPPEGGINIHYNKDIFKKGENFYKTMLDLYMCKKSNKFIPSIGSGFSIMVNEANHI